MWCLIVATMSSYFAQIGSASIKSKRPSISLSSLSYYSPGLLLTLAAPGSSYKAAVAGANVMAGSPIIGASILWCFSGRFWASRRRPGGSYKGGMMRERERPVKNPSVSESNRSCVRMMIARRFFLA